MNALRKLLLLSAIGLYIAAPLALTACNTVEGAGEDLQDASNAVEDEIED